MIESLKVLKPEKSTKGFDQIQKFPHWFNQIAKVKLKCRLLQKLLGMCTFCKIDFENQISLNTSKAQIDAELFKCINSAKFMPKIKNDLEKYL